MKTPAPLSYKPSAFYYRAELRAAKTIEDVKEIAFQVVSELEDLKAWVRAQGLIPPKWRITRSELEEKHWAEIVPFPSSGESGQTSS